MTDAGQMELIVPQGACTSPNNTRAQLISLYFATGADILTEVLGRELPSPCRCKSLTERSTLNPTSASAKTAQVQV